ncbi:hypothetical protein SAMN05421767_10238 [Granulicatella balaenopterae]|uniref:Uncharacterized protein n=1 Tax=Granulicatella balaenopterae TaxID=137733 RepID=A0A1H9H9P3_9LACT|nr:hypothetical protein [Granulicatella balaenopterae]SEQ59050.1 hypothetical protein SAMN05421767_10238 [Granulicatella balaenopterae]
MRKSSKSMGCLYTILISLVILCGLAVATFFWFKKEATIETIQVPQEVETIKVEEEDIRYNVLAVDTLEKISKIIRVEEEVILKAYGLKQSENFEAKKGQQIDILAAVQIVEKNNQLMAIVEAQDNTKREIVIAKPTNLKVKDIVGTGTIIVVTESNHQIAEAILVEKDLETGLLKEKGNAVAQTVAIPTVEKDIKQATSKDLEVAIDEKKAKTVSTTVPKNKAKKPIKINEINKSTSINASLLSEIDSHESSKESSSNFSSNASKEEASIIIGGDNWIEFTEKYQEDYTEEVPKYKEVEIVRNQVYYLDHEGVEHIYGWYDEIEHNQEYDTFIKEQTQDGKVHYRDVVVDKREIQVGVENVTKTRIGERQAWRNERTGEVVYQKP